MTKAPPRRDTVHVAITRITEECLRSLLDHLLGFGGEYGPFQNDGRVFHHDIHVDIDRIGVEDFGREELCGGPRLEDTQPERGRSGSAKH